MKINLDKYYTDKTLALYCINKTQELCPDITEYIEPSAGNGSFSLQISNCCAYDIAPEHPSIEKCDFFKLNLDYKKGRCFIGNPPFGERNNLSIKFYKRCVNLGDYIGFIQPASQYNNSQQLYEFDLIFSELLPKIEYSGKTLLCCFNIYRRPKNGNLNTSKPDYKLKEIKIMEYRRHGNYKKPKDFIIGLNGWGNLNNKTKIPGTYAQEFFINFNLKEENKKIENELLLFISNFDWNSLSPSISTKKLQAWRIFKTLKEAFPTLT